MKNSAFLYFLFLLKVQLQPTNNAVHDGLESNLQFQSEIQSSSGDELVRLSEISLFSSNTNGIFLG